MLTAIHLKKNVMRVTRDPVIPLTRVTLFVGPNGSGKSTVIEAINELIHGKAEQGSITPWTKETAPVIPVGNTGGVMVFSFEKDNPRLADLRNAHSSEMASLMAAKEQSHGQCNFERLVSVFNHPAYDVLVLDEPESAIDVDGLFWLRNAILTTSKQVVLATHSVILLSLLGQQGVSVQEFGPEPGYVARIRQAYTATLEGLPLPVSKPRLPKPKQSEGAGSRWKNSAGKIAIKLNMRMR